MSKIDKAELAGLTEAVLARLAGDARAQHLWHWRSRPRCADEPIGPSRRSHLTTLLGLLGGSSALGGLAAACSDTKKVAECGDDPCASDARTDANKDAKAVKDAAASDAPRDVVTCGDDPCASDAAPDRNNDIKDCADDPCGCADDPCACADDPCGCGDDPCGCADDPCACADDPC